MNYARAGAGRTTSTVNGIKDVAPNGGISRLLVNEKTAAEMLSVSARTLFTWRQRGEVPYLKVGGRILYSPEALAAWIESSQGASESAST